MKKKIFIFSGIIICLITVYLVLGNFDGSERMIFENNEESNQIVNSNALTMMYETEANSGEYQVSSDITWPQDGYVFNDQLSSCENGSELTWDDENKRVIMSTSVSDKCYVYFDVYVEPTFADTCREENSNTLACKVATNYTEDGESGLYYHDGQGSYTNASQEAGDNSYRYAGADPNNYVCFGPGAETEGTCPNDNLYRIIGVFDDAGEYQIKLIKADYTTSAMLGTDGRDYDGAYNSDTSNYKGSMNTATIATYSWNYDTSVSSGGSNNWTTSEFNTINLNTNYWNYLGSTWQNLIAETTWHFGGMISNINTAKAFYDGERNNAGYGSNPTSYSDEIGLMYPSDYGYAASPDAWATNLNLYRGSTITTNNWLYMGLNEWTLTPNSSNSYYVFYVFSNGGIASSYNGTSARPVFYLNSNVELESGSGTSRDPYRLAV